MTYWKIAHNIQVQIKKKQPKEVCQFGLMTGIPVKDQRNYHGGQVWF